MPRITIVADGDRERYQPCIEAHLTDGAVLRWDEYGGSDAYVLTWEAACDMTAALCAEAGLPPPCAARLTESVSRLKSAPHVDEMIAAMIAACAAERETR